LTGGNGKVEVANRWVENLGTVKWSRLVKGGAAPADTTCPSNCQAWARLRFSVKCHREFPWEGGDAYLCDAHGPKPPICNPVFLCLQLRGRMEMTHEILQDTI